MKLFTQVAPPCTRVHPLNPFCSCSNPWVKNALASTSQPGGRIPSSWCFYLVAIFMTGMSLYCPSVSLTFLKFVEKYGFLYPPCYSQRERSSASYAIFTFMRGTDDTVCNVSYWHARTSGCTWLVCHTSSSETVNLYPHYAQGCWHAVPHMSVCGELLQHLHILTTPTYNDQ